MMSPSGVTGEYATDRERKCPQNIRLWSSPPRRVLARECVSCAGNAVSDLHLYFPFLFRAHGASRQWAIRARVRPMLWSAGSGHQSVGTFRGRRGNGRGGVDGVTSRWVARGLAQAAPCHPGNGPSGPPGTRSGWLLRWHKSMTRICGHRTPSRQGMDNGWTVLNCRESDVPQMPMSGSCSGLGSTHVDADERARPSAQIGRFRERAAYRPLRRM